MDRNEMADYSIGDRVEVRWQTGLFDAAVIHVHSPGKVDVVYDIDGSVGIFLTAEEHGLKLLGDVAFLLWLRKSCETVLRAGR